MNDATIAILTIGHSTRPIDEFLALLEAHRIAILSDVRRFVGSRRFPQFGPELLPPALQGRGVRYQHLPELGGRRRAAPDSPNPGWRNAAFRGYADYMATDTFAAGIERLIELANEGTVAIMCAEALWWRCHRRLIADALIVRGRAVAHIMGPGPAVAHHLTDFAHVDGLRITYPAPPDAAAEPSG